MLIFEYSSIICKKCNPGNHIVTGASLLIGVNFSVGPMSPDLSYLTRCPLSVLRSNFGRLGLPEHLTTFIIVCCGISPNSQHMASNLSRAEASLFEPSSLISWQFPCRSCLSLHSVLLLRIRRLLSHLLMMRT